MATTGSWDLGRLLTLSEARNAHAAAHGYNGFTTPPFGRGIEPPGMVDFVVAAETITQTQFHREIGAVMQRVRRGEHVKVTNYGRTDVVILSDAEYADLVRDREESERR
jgi:prevent-host-death family protein